MKALAACPREREVHLLEIEEPSIVGPTQALLRTLEVGIGGFTWSNCVHSGIRRVALLSQYRAASLAHHVEGAWRPRFRKERGAYVRTLPADGDGRGYRGTADAVRRNLEFVREQAGEHVLVLSGDHVYRMAYGGMLAAHAEQGADVTLAGVPVPAAEAPRFGILDVDEEARVRCFRETPGDIDPSGPRVLANMGVYLFRTEFLVEAILEDPAALDFGRDLLPRLVRAGAQVEVHLFGGRHWRDIGTLDSYYDAHLDLLAGRFELDHPQWPVRPAHETARPVRVSGPGSSSSILASGVVVRDATVTDSVLGPRACVQPGARVERSVLLPGVTVGRDAVVRNAILDEDCVVPAGAIVDAAWSGKAPYAVTPRGRAVVSGTMDWSAAAAHALLATAR